MVTSNFTELLTPLRTIKGKVVLLNSTTLPKPTKHTFNNTDKLKSFKIERVGESGKFFGFGIVQKLTVNIIDTERRITVADGDEMQAHLTATDVYPEALNIYPTFFVNANEAKRNENTNELTIVGYDYLASATQHTFSELNLTAPYTLYDIAMEITELLTGGEYPVARRNMGGIGLSLTLPNGANYDGTETLKEVLDDIAEATQSIYFLDDFNKMLWFRGLQEEADLRIDKSQYFELESQEPVMLSAICSVTELGDNVIAEGNIQEGVTQYVRDNGIYTTREDLDSLLASAIQDIEGLTMQPFSCTWRGNYYLEIGDNIQIEGKDGNYVNGFVLDDVIEYNGALKQTTQWQYVEQENIHANPTTLGEALKQTYAKVDKANKRIEIVASEANANTSAISQLVVDTGNIFASVSDLKTQTEDALKENSDDIETLKNSVSLQMTPDDVTILIQDEMTKGVDKVQTSTGFTFDDEGLTVNKTDSEMKTTISEDGMKVFKNNEQVLTADNVGVNAKNLHAVTYLIIGNNSRFEDYGNRTGCFWIGGNS